MPTINQLPLITQLSGGDNVVLWVPNQGDSRRASITTLIQYIAGNLGDAITATVKTQPVTFAELPNAATVGAGTRAFVTDSNTAVFAATVAGGGVNAVPVYSNGTDWKVG